MSLEGVYYTLFMLIHNEFDKNENSPVYKQGSCYLS